MNLEEFADIILKDFRLKRYANQNNRWSASFVGAEVKDTEHSSILAGSFGDGKTPSEAMNDYLIQIRGKILVFNAGGGDKRREYGVPENLEL